MSHKVFSVYLILQDNLKTGALSFSSQLLYDGHIVTAHRRYLPTYEGFLNVQTICWWSFNMPFNMCFKVHCTCTFGFLRNPSLNLASCSRYSWLLLTVEMMITRLSCPWKTSTDPTLTSVRLAFWSNLVIFWTCETIWHISHIIMWNSTSLGIRQYRSNSWIMMIKIRTRLFLDF